MTIHQHLHRPLPHQLPQPTVPDMDKLLAEVLVTNLGYQANEPVTVVTDVTSQNLAAAWSLAGHKLGAATQWIVLAELTNSGQTPPDELCQLCAHSGIVILHTSYSLTHTTVAEAGQKARARVASLPGVTAEMLTRTLAVDYRQIKQLNQKLANILSTSTTLQISSAAGTNLTTRVRTKAVLTDDGLIESGNVGNLPGGEVFFAPLEHSTNGQIVIDGSMADDELDAPITIQIKNGQAVNISGGQAAANLERKLTALGPAAFKVAEIGLGTNPAARAAAAVIEAEKAYGTVHVAFGNSAHIGGANDVPIHLDGVILAPTVLTDSTKIMELSNYCFAEV